MKFYIEDIELRDEQQRLVYAGVEWTEYRPFLEALMRLIMNAGFLAALGYSLGFFFDKTAPWWLLGLIVGSLAVVFGAAAIEAEYRGVRRVLRFTHDGAIEAPCGLDGHPGVRAGIRYHVSDIANIQLARRANATDWADCQVWLYMSGGERMIAAQGIGEDQAHMLVVRLTRALERIKSSVERSSPCPGLSRQIA